MGAAVRDPVRGPGAAPGARRAGRSLPARPRGAEIRLPAFSSAANGAFSPDGRLLALELTFGNGGNGGGVATQLEVASVDSDRLTVVPGSWASSDALAGFGWPSDDDSLVAELSFMTKVQVASWHLGTGRLAVAVVRPGQNPDELIVGLALGCDRSLAACTTQLRSVAVTRPTTWVVLVGASTTARTSPPAAAWSAAVRPDRPGAARYCGGTAIATWPMRRSCRSAGRMRASASVVTIPAS